MSLKVIAISGSLRKGSYTTTLLKAIGKIRPTDIEYEILDISDLPLINQDLEDDLPEAVKKLHRSIESADAVIFASPEYNRSYSPVVKNALDWGSRPEGKNKWKKKPAAILGCSPYSLGGFGAVNHFRQAMLYVDLYTLQQPEFYLSEASKKIDADGNITDETTKKLVYEFWGSFDSWIKLTRG
ncbi:MAG: NADPH-dependent oxidoreductase [Chitinophagaceae bacterium]|nr:MAG: NADPH-dependent oxidoreductase [Chitinophagaceae bacterium]